MLGTTGRAPRLLSKAALCALALLVFALATYARMSWYRQDCLEKTYLVKAVKLMDNRARIDIEAQALPSPQPANVERDPDATPRGWPVTVEPAPSHSLHIYDPAYFRPPPALS